MLRQWRDVPMPNQGLSTSDVTAVLAYLETAETAAAQPSGQAASAPVQGNPEIGKALFTGVTRFQNGGPPCVGCHSAGGIGTWAAGSLGPT